jgi:hypothetical protein
MIENALRGDFHDWHGLPDGTDLETVLAALRPFDSAAAPVERIRGPRRSLVVAVEPGPIEIWCELDGITVRSIELEAPGIAADALERQLDPPELTLPDRRFAAHGVATEHVFASRGVTASIVQPFDPSAPRRVGYLQLYAAMSATEYLTEIGVAAHARPHP